MKMNSIDLHKQYISEILKGDNTHADEFASICVELTKKIAYSNNFIFTCEESIEDFCNDVFLHVYKNLNKYNNEYAFSTWLSTVTKRYYYRKYNDRAKAIKPSRLDDKANKEDMDKYEKIVGGESAESTYLNGLPIAWSKLYKAIDNLNANYASAIKLFYLMNYSVNEVADKLEATPNQINNWLARGRAKLLAFCNDEGLKGDLYGEAGR